MRRLLILIAIVIFLAAALFLTLTRQSKAQERCTAYAALTAHLAQKYGEHRAAMAAMANGLLAEWLTSENGTWTMLLIRPDGTACLFASGEGFQLMAKRGRDGRS